ncbi:Peptidase S46 [Caulifigura coniformis]|uniref:Dipeptidyl-peptidase n=1 Tax=Caulifigura coniformis TaxID=2527983 RepID=A0A517SDB9_9PLAN|nr:S46 family peptidase [Caulifigura coniformis]QDT54118.1 Peptidase S46 [Caulifigura coniformis]
MSRKFLRPAMMAFASLAIAAGLAQADEGMWLFNALPKKQLKERYGFDATDEWTHHLMRSCVRFPGGSGSFVSPEGLVITNHHVGSEFIDQLSTAEHNYIKDGFSAKTRAEELKCPDLELNNLVSIEDVTARVTGSVKEGMDLAASQKARQATINTIEKEAQDKTKLKCQVVTLYQGAQYHLYSYKRYTDVRLVMAPEMQIAFFGGDPDNFEYPRYCLDFCVFRVYEDDKPVKPEHFLKWGKDLKEEDLVFIAGHPARTNRLNTVAHLEYMRDIAVPEILELLRRLEVALNSWSGRSPENGRRAKDDLFGIQNSRKARTGGLETLQSPEFMDAKMEFEKEFRSKIAANPGLKSTEAAFHEVAEACKAWEAVRHDYNNLERGAAFESKMFHFARSLVRYADEIGKPNADRLKDFSESNLPTIRDGLEAPVPVYPDLEIIKLRSSLTRWFTSVGADDPLLKKVLDGASPVERAAALVNGSRLHEADYRKELLEGGPEKIRASQDPLLKLARIVDEKARQARKTYETQVEERLRQAYSKIAAARLALGGEDVYPDATFSLRLSFGPVASFEENGQKVQPFTHFAGLYKRWELNDRKEPFDLPKRWIEARDKLNLETPFNFVSKLDHIGGNSGSPIVDREGRIVGLLFDSNIYGLALDVGYTDKQCRAVSVDARAIVESLKKVYGAQALVDEMTN